MTAENYAEVPAPVMTDRSPPENHGAIGGVTAAATTPGAAIKFDHAGDPGGDSSAKQRRAFLEQVVSWPADAQAPGWINLHCHVRHDVPHKNGGKPFMTGHAFKTVDKALTWLERTSKSGGSSDFYFCTSQQSEIAGIDKNGKPKAKRNAANATFLKATWLDIDVKADDPQRYGTLDEAWSAFVEFRKKVGLPFPSAIVQSGGGLHIYWISDTPLTIKEWRPYADGLKARASREGLKADHSVFTAASQASKAAEYLRGLVLNTTSQGAA